MTVIDRQPFLITRPSLGCSQNVAKAGEHEVMFSMREDGFESDRFILTMNREFAPPADAGPESRMKSGKMAAPNPVTLLAQAAPAMARVPAGQAPMQPRQSAGRGTVSVSGELKQWHKVTLTLDGPFAHERDTLPNPFTDLAFNVTFTHESGSLQYAVPGYFAADGNAADSSAQSGTKWRAHLSPDKAGQWNYAVAFAKSERELYCRQPKSAVPGLSQTTSKAPRASVCRPIPATKAILEFFHANNIPFWEMRNADALVGNAKNNNSKFCLANAGKLYLVFLPNGGTTELDLAGAEGSFTVNWFNPRTSGALQSGSVKSVKGGSKVSLGMMPSDATEDWLAVVHK